MSNATGQIDRLDDHAVKTMLGLRGELGDTITFGRFDPAHHLHRGSDGLWSRTEVTPHAERIADRNQRRQHLRKKSQQVRVHGEVVTGWNLAAWQVKNGEQSTQTDLGGWLVRHPDQQRWVILHDTVVKALAATPTPPERDLVPMASGASVEDAWDDLDALFAMWFRVARARFRHEDPDPEEVAVVQARAPQWGLDLRA